MVAESKKKRKKKRPTAKINTDKTADQKTTTQRKEKVESC